MKQFVPVLLLVTLVAGSDRLLGDRRCTWGPSYWCSDVAHTKECGAVDHCASTYWKQEIPAVQGADEASCNECQDFVGEISRALQQSEQSGAAFLRYVCSLPASTYKKECAVFNGDNQEVFMGLVHHSYDALSICKLFKRCSHSGQKAAKKVPSIIPLSKSPITITHEKVGATESTCDVCERVFGFVYITLNNNASKAEALQLINQYVCKALGSYAAVCTGLVDQYFDQAYDLLVQELYPSKICSDVHLCELAAKLFKEFPKSTTVNCQECTDVIGYIANMFKNTTVQAELKTDLLNFCNTLGALESGICKEAVNSQFDQLYSQALAALTPQFVCSQVHLCPAAVKSVGSCRMPTPKLAAKPLKAKDGQFCAVCEAAISYAKQMIQNQGTEDEVKTYLETELCGALGSLKQECVTLVDEYFDEVYQMLINDVDAAQICGYLGLCSSSYVSKKVKVDAPCELCLTLDSMAYNALKDPKTQAKIKAAIESMCTLLGNSSGVCNATIESVFSVAMNYVLETIADGKAFCQAVGLCQQNCSAPTPAKKPEPIALVKASPVKLAKGVKASTECVLCEFVMNKLDSLLEKNATEEEIVAALEKVCSLLPATVTKECNTFVDQYTPMIINILAQVADPQQVCTLIGLCKSSQAQGLKLGDECSTCEGVLNEIKTLLKSEEGTEKQLLLDVCAKLPGEIGTECTALINQYGDAVLEMLISAIDAASVCKDLGLCTTAKTLQAGRFVPDGRLHIV